MKFIKSTIVFSVAFISVVVFFELFLRYAGILSPVVRIDPEKGERYLPNKMCSSLFVSEGFGLAKTNSSGWFGKNFSDEGTNDISVAVLGNSFVASRHVFYRQNFLSIAENSLQGTINGKTASLFNFGKEDFPLKELLYVKDDIMKTYNPDYFLVLLNPGVFNSNSQRYVAYYDFVGGKFQVDTSFKKASFVKNYSKIQPLTQSSILFLVHRAKNQLPNAGEILFEKFYFPMSNKDENNENKAEGMEAEADTINTTDAAVVKKLSEDPRVIFLLNLDPRLSKLVDPIIQNSRKIDLWPYLLAMQQSEEDPYYWPIPDKKGHWNIRAHEMVGKVIASHLSQLINKEK